MIPVNEYWSFQCITFWKMPSCSNHAIITKTWFLFLFWKFFFIVTAHMSPLPMQPSHWQLFNRTPAEWLMACQKCLYKSPLMNHQDSLTIETVHKPPSTDLFPLISHSEESQSNFSQSLGKTQLKKIHNAYWPLLLKRVFLGKTLLPTSTHIPIGTHVLTDHLIRPRLKHLDLPWLCGLTLRC